MKERVFVRTSALTHYIPTIATYHNVLSSANDVKREATKAKIFHSLGYGIFTTSQWLQWPFPPCYALFRIFSGANAKATIIPQIMEVLPYLPYLYRHRNMP